MKQTNTERIWNVVSMFVYVLLLIALGTLLKDRGIRIETISIFDLLLIHSHYTVSWPDILDAAHKKAGFSNDELVIRIQTFPRHMLNQISCIDCGFLDNFQDDIAAVIAGILHA